MSVVAENESKILKFGKDFYDTFQNIQKIAFSLECSCYVYGSVIHEILSRREIYNPRKFIDVIFVCSLNKKDFFRSINKFFNLRHVTYVDPVAICEIENEYNLNFYFLPDFVATVFNTEFGFTIDQIYYNIKENKLIDTTGEGLNHFTSLPMIIKTTADKDHWNEDLALQFLLKVGTFYEAQIDDEDFASLKEMPFEHFNELEMLLLLNRPGTAIKTLLELFPESEKAMFDALLKIFFNWKVSIRENMSPLKVFNEEKFNLLDLYSDYFNSSKDEAEKRKKAITLAKILIEIL